MKHRHKEDLVPVPELKAEIEAWIKQKLEENKTPARHTFVFVQFYICDFYILYIYKV